MNESEKPYSTCGKCGTKIEPSRHSWRRCFDCQRAERREEFKEETRWDPDRIVQLMPISGHRAFRETWKEWDKAANDVSRKPITREQYFEADPSTEVLALGLTAGGEIKAMGLEDWPGYVVPLEDYLIVEETEIETSMDAIWEWASRKDKKETA